MNAEAQLIALLKGLEVPYAQIDTWLKQDPKVFKEFGYCLAQTCKGFYVNTAVNLQRVGFKE